VNKYKKKKAVKCMNNIGKSKSKEIVKNVKIY
jgi:hypothetical protein